MFCMGAVDAEAGSAEMSVAEGSASSLDPLAASSAGWRGDSAAMLRSGRCGLT